MTPAEARIVAVGARDVGVEVGPDAIARLDRFLGLLEVWNRRFHLTGERDRKRLIENHLVDSLAVVPHLPQDGVVVDVGSGAGFPGIILACLRTDLEIVLLESRRKPTSFLRESLRAIPLSRVRVVESRAEDTVADPALAGHAALVTARALRLDAFLPLAAPLLAAGGEAIAMQTPATARAAADAGSAVGLHVVRRHDYRLPGGAGRTLVVWRRTSDPLLSVP